MCPVTLLLSGVPESVPLKDLSHDLDFLFNTDEVGTFKVRVLPNHPITKTRQIALDFRTGFDAMAAQEKLDGYLYELPNGRECRLTAKINKVKEYMRSESSSPDRSERWTEQGHWYREIYRAHVKFDAQLELLKKQKLVLETEREILREKRRLKREYEYMEAHGSDIGRKSKRSRPTRERRSGSRSRHSSRSRDLSLRAGREWGRRSHSTDYEPRAPQIEWYYERETRELRSLSSDMHSGSQERDLPQLERSVRSRSRRSSARSICGARGARERNCREQRSSWERNYRERRSSSLEKINEHRAKPREGVYKGAMSTSREPAQIVRRSRSRERIQIELRTRERVYREHRQRSSRSNERSVLVRRSRSRNRDTVLRDCSRDAGVQSRSYRMCRDRRSRSPVRRSHEGLKMISGRSLGSREDANSEQQMPKLAEETSVIDSGATDQMATNKAGYNKTLRTATVIEIQEETDDKNINKFNSNIRKADRLEAKVESITKDVMFLVLVLLEDIMNKEKIRISISNKILLDKKIEALVKERVEPLARVKHNSDVDILKKYKINYPKHADMMTLKKMLDDIPKLTEETQAVSSKIVTNGAVKIEKRTEKSTEQLDGDSNLKPIEKNTNDTLQRVSSEIDLDNVKEENCSKTPESQKITDILDDSEGNVEFIAETIKSPKETKSDKNNTKFDTKEVLPEIKRTKRYAKDEIVIIDVESTERPVPKRSQFVPVMNPLLKDMNDVIKSSNLSKQIKLNELKYVVREILETITKGQAHMPRPEIRDKFRALYPKENDEQFVKDVIKDIEDGKYPGLCGSKEDASEIDGEDGVLLIEKECEVVTLTDSDDDVLEVKMPMEVIDLECEAEVPTAPDNPAAVIFEPALSDPTNPGLVQLGTTIPSSFTPSLVNPVQDKPGIVTAGSVTAGSVNPGQAKSELAVPILAKLLSTTIDPNKPSQVQLGPATDKEALGSASPSQGNHGSAIPSLISQDNLGLETADPITPTQARLAPASPSPTNMAQMNLGLATSDPVTTSSASLNQVAPLVPVTLGPDNPGRTNLGQPNLNQAKRESANLDKVLLVPVTTNQDTLGQVNPGQNRQQSPNLDQAMPGLANLDPVKFSLANSVPATHGPVNPDQDKFGTANPDHTWFRARNPTTPRPANMGPSSRSANPGQAKLGLPKPGQVTLERASRGQKTFRTTKSSSTKNTVKPKFQMPKKSELQSGANNKDPQLECYDNENRMTPETTNTEINQNQMRIEDSDSLKVTAITIVTSLDELKAIADKTNGSAIEAPVKIKEELEIPEPEADYRLEQSDQDPQVTAITIMTSYAELLSISQGVPETKEIKSEVDEDILNDNEASNIVGSNEIVRNERGNRNSEKASEKQISEGNKSIDEEDESIDSILKYIQSLM